MFQAPRCNLQNCLSCCVITHFLVTLKDHVQAPNFQSLQDTEHNLSHWRRGFLWLFVLFKKKKTFTKWYISSSSCYSSVFGWRPKPSSLPLWKRLPRSPDTSPSTRGRALRSCAGESPHPGWGGKKWTKIKASFRKKQELDCKAAKTTISKGRRKKHVSEGTL